jgi:hypothetical protein
MADEVTPAAVESTPTPVNSDPASSTSVEAPRSTETERSAVEASVGSKFSSVFKDADDDTVVEPAETVTDPKTGEEKPAEASVEAAATEQAPKPTPGATPATQVVPAAYARSLKAYGWTEDEIGAAYKADPANFLRTAAKFHENRNEETRRMSEMGRLAKQQADTQQAAAQPPPSSVSEKFSVIDIAALKKAYGDKEPFVQQLEQVNKVVEFANQVMPWMKQSQERQRQAEMQTLSGQIDSFFGGKDLAEYADAYGKTAADLKPEQMASRQKVLETADLLIRGARVSGRTLSLDDALTMAHDSVSGPVKTKAVRQEIVAAVKTRNAAISLKPSSRSSSAKGDTPRKNLETKVGKSLAGVFSGN